MKFASLDIIVLTVSFLLPGFIVRSLLRYLFPQRETDKDALFLELSLFGMIPFVVFLAVFGPALNGEAGVTAVVANRWDVVLWAAIVIVLPLALSLGWAYVVRQESVREFAIQHGFAPLRGEPSAWDFLFHRRCTGAVHLLVTLKDGTTVRGEFERLGSAASSDRSERDLLIGVMMREGEDGMWAATEHPKSVWIAGGEIKLVEVLWPPTNNQDDESDREEENSSTTIATEQ